MKQKTVLYIVSRAIRVNDNQALYKAQKKALLNNHQLICLFNYYPNFPYANLRNMHFLLSGLLEMSTKLIKLNIPLLLRVGNISDTLNDINKEFDISSIYTEHHVLKPILKNQSIISEFCYNHKIDFYKVNVLGLKYYEMTLILQLNDHHKKHQEQYFEQKYYKDNVLL